MMKFKATCQCHQCKLLVELPQSLRHYAPRACDCNYCQLRNISYLSDPTGFIEVFSGASLLIDRHGSEQAEFYNCSTCGDFLFVAITSNGQTIGAVNANILNNKEQLARSQRVSPKQLAADQKLARWRQVWMPLSFHSTNP